MTTYVSMLRGINVSGQKLIKMADLKALYEATGFVRVTTYIQSGNVVFESSKKDPKALATIITKAIASKYGFDVPVVVLRMEDIREVIQNNPLVNKTGINEEKLYVIFLSDAPETERAEALHAWATGPETFVIKDKAVYVHYPDGYGKTKLTNNVFENKLKVMATTRNWRTTNELYKIMCTYS